MSDTDNLGSTTRGAITRKIKKGAKYDLAFVEVASRMVAANMTEREVGFFLGVKPATIKQWKKRYEEFKNATDSQSSAKTVANSHLVANGLRSAMGYDYEEVEQVLVPEKDEKTGATTMVVKSEKRKLKHRPPDKDLLMFFLMNMSNEWHNTKQIAIEQTQKQINVNITAELESDDIRMLAGAAFDTANDMDKKVKVVESKIIDVIESSEGGESIPPTVAFDTLVDVDSNKDFLESINDD